MNPAQEDPVVYRASEVQVVQKEKQESQAKTVKKGHLDPSDRLDNRDFPERGETVAAMDLKEMQDNLEAEVNLELLEKLVNPVDVVNQEKKELKVLLQPKGSRVSWAHEETQECLVLVVIKVFLDSKDQLVYLVSLDHQAQVAEEEKKVYLAQKV